MCLVDCVRGVVGEGMPVFRRPSEKGQLYIKFSVQFPENHWIDEDKLKQLESLLSKRPHFEIPDNHEEVDLIDIEATRGHTTASGRSNEVYDADHDHEGHGHHGHRVGGCTQQ